MPNNDVTVISIKQTPAVGADLKIRNVTRVSIMVGEHGTFTKDFPAGQDSPEIINAWKQQKKNEVNAILNG